MISVNETIIWLTIEKDFEYEISDSNNKKTIFSIAYFCYFKLTKPKPFFYGELLRDSKGVPKVFHTVKDAISYAKEELRNRF